MSFLCRMVVAHKSLGNCQTRRSTTPWVLGRRPNGRGVPPLGDRGMLGQPGLDWG